MALVPVVAGAALAGCTGDPAAPAPSSSTRTTAAVVKSSTPAGPKFGNLALLVTLPSKDVCALVPTTVAQAALGKPLAEAPTGVADANAGTNCIWKTAEGAQVKVEFNKLTWSGALAIAAGGDQRQDTTVAGQPAVTYSLVDNVAYIVKLGADGDPLLYVEAPNARAASTVAAAAVGSLAKR